MEAFLHQCWKVTEDTCRSPEHKWEWTWPLLNLPSPTGPQDASLAVAERGALASFHRDRFTLTQAAAKYMPGAGKGGRGGGEDAKLTKAERQEQERKRKEAAKKKGGGGDGEA